ncbi:hydrogenase maturation protease [Tistlia consotensis]|uniref:Hydrogenase maturation protease n=1 Tax=Tistlia consotensis USBA 355 TaxID=560819 RepID=A0A1Y6BUP2_9PROT|nr:hydrogenase maturation protease [Tistlia consotensis]SMF28888.1 hydrogenase maturation protease [Tistlia consotensis USBA 355]SNR91829.1 hydrogenase maturation protease [Tistlia consotensis]
MAGAGAGAEAAGRCLVIGLGNPDRGDDGLGRAVARALLGGRLPPGIEVVEAEGEATALLARLEGAAAAFLVDACVSGAPAGTIRRFDLGVSAQAPDAAPVSSHGLGLAEAVGLGRTLGLLPPRCILYAVEGACFEAGAPLTPAVAAAVDEVAERLRAELR